MVVCALLGRAEDGAHGFLEKMAGIHNAGSEVMSGGRAGVQEPLKNRPEKYFA
jgi:hypothetical protein